MSRGGGVFSTDANLGQLGGCAKQQFFLALQFSQIIHISTIFTLSSSMSPCKHQAPHPGRSPLSRAG
jgi:hypothetical protein